MSAIESFAATHEMTDDLALLGCHLRAVGEGEPFERHLDLLLRAAERFADLLVTHIAERECLVPTLRELHPPCATELRIVQAEHGGLHWGVRALIARIAGRDLAGARQAARSLLVQLMAHVAHEHSVAALVVDSVSNLWLESARRGLEPVRLKFEGRGATLDVTLDEDGVMESRFQCTEDVDRRCAELARQARAQLTGVHPLALDAVAEAK